jgi:hypothetical protein
MYVCLSRNARREEAAAYEVLHGSLETKAGLAGAHDRKRGVRQIRDGIVVLDSRVLKRAHRTRNRLADEHYGGIALLWRRRSSKRVVKGLVDWGGEFLGHSGLTDMVIFRPRQQAWQVRRLSSHSKSQGEMQHGSVIPS